MINSDDSECARLLAELNRAVDRKKYQKVLDDHYVRLNTIAIKDSGEGMSHEDLEKVYLRIGTRHRRRQNEGGAIKLGDKGIGRLSAMRLGDKLVVETTRAGEKHWNILEVDWSLFSHSEDMLVQDIEVAPELGEQKDDPDESGTTIRISKLNADWSWVRFNELLDGKNRPIRRSVRGRAGQQAAYRQAQWTPGDDPLGTESAHATCARGLPSDISLRERRTARRREGRLSGKTPRHADRSSRLRSHGAQPYDPQAPGQTRPCRLHRNADKSRCPAKTWWI